MWVRFLSNLSPLRPLFYLFSVLLFFSVESVHGIGVNTEGGNKREKVHIMVECAYPPFQFRDSNGAMRGISIDFLRMLEEKTSLSFTWGACRALSHNLAMMQKGANAIVPNLAITCSRSRFLKYADPYISVPAVILTRRSIPGNVSLKDLSGKTVAAGKEYAVADYLITTHPAIVLDEVRDDHLALRRLALVKKIARELLSGTMVTCWRKEQYHDQHGHSVSR